MANFQHNSTVQAVRVSCKSRALSTQPGYFLGSSFGDQSYLPCSQFSTERTCPVGQLSPRNRSKTVISEGTTENHTDKGCNAFHCQEAERTMGPIRISVS